MHLRAVAAAQGIAEVLLLFEKIRQIIRQQILSRHRGRAERKRLPRLFRGEERAQRVAVAQNALGNGVDLLAVRRQANVAAVAAHEQFLSQRLFKQADVRADGRLVEEKLFCGTGEATVFHNGDKDFKLLETDIIHRGDRLSGTAKRAGKSSW